MGIVTRYEYDARGLLTAVIENACEGAGCLAPANVRTEYAYDAYGNRVEISDANRTGGRPSDPTTFAYDELGRLTDETDPLDHTTAYEYDAGGRRVGTTDANGFTTAYEYDGLGRLVFIDYPDPDFDVAFTYDGLGRRLAMDDDIGCTGTACRAPSGVQMM